MGSLIDLIIKNGSVVDLVIFLLGLGVVGYVVLLRNKVLIQAKELKELKEKYHLLNNMVEKVGLFIEPIIKRKLIKQAPGGEWTAHNPLSGD